VTFRPCGPKKKRPLEAKRMTIVIGMLSDSGVVIAADTEETSDVKRDVSKLEEAFNGCGGTLVVGGAGGVPHIEGCTELIVDAFKKASGENIGELTEQFKEIIRTFYQEYVLCWPTAEERQANDFSLLIGAAMRKEDNREFSLWIAEKGVLRSVRGFRGHAAIGSGSAYANNLMDRRRLGQSLAEEILTAIHVVMKVKCDMPYCGKNTDIYWLDGTESCFPVRKNPLTRASIIERAESLFAELEMVNLEQFQSLIEADHEMPHSAGKEEINKQIRQLRKQFAALILEGFPPHMRCEM